MTFQQAYLLVDNGDRIDCWFNPSSLSVTQRARWTTGRRDTVPTFLGIEDQALSLKLLLHADGLRTGLHVKVAIKGLKGLLTPVEVPGTPKRLRPRTVRFVWGSDRSDPAVCTSVTVSTELFDLDGTPLRAWVTLGLKLQTPPTDQPTNPTTRATHRRRAHVVAPGEDLALVAHRHYRDPTRWREIADANDLDDPLRVRAPAVLVVPLEQQ